MSTPRTPARVTVRRHPERGAYDADTIHAILDEGFLCHVGFVADDQPFVIPTLYARAGDTLYLHGSPLSRLPRHLADGIPLCVTVTLVDGVVLARSAFHHSINYRSVVILGRGRVVTEPGAKEEALRALVDGVVPGRSADARGPDAQELKATLVIAVPLAEASARARTGPPKDAPDDYGLEWRCGRANCPCVCNRWSPSPMPGWRRTSSCRTTCGTITVSNQWTHRLSAWTCGVVPRRDTFTAATLGVLILGASGLALLAARPLASGVGRRL